MSNPEIDKYGYKIWFNEKGEIHREDGPACEFSDGDKRWFINGKLHREDGPAIELYNGDKSWYINGKLHRIDGPAIEYLNGDKEWYIEGKQYTEEEYNKKILEMNNKNPEIDKYENKIWKNEKGEIHRIDWPAVEYSNGTKEWYVNGNLHREDGPAIEFANGDKEWIINDKRHRLDGPAIEYFNGDKFWYIDGIEFNSEEEYYKAIFDIKNSKFIINEYGDKVWFNEKGEIHREDSPAIEYKDGSKGWYINGKYHRIDGPAYECYNGIKEWYINDKLHRLDGPAIENYNGYKRWYIEGKEYTEEEYNKKVSEMNSFNKKENPEIDEDGNKIWKNEKGELHRIDGPAVELVNGDKSWYKNGNAHRIDGPAIEYINGTKYWYINGKLHRENGPAIENSNGDKSWYKDGKRHRLNGPAIELFNGNKEWYIEGKQYTEEEYNKKILEMNNKNPEIDKYENKIWKNEQGKIHRIDGPAIERSNGTKEWYVNGNLHREDGPAVEYSNGTKEWYVNGNLHREDGPAIEWSNGDKEWIINDKRHRLDGPAIEYLNGDKSWYINGKLHRIDGPAVELYNGYKAWYIEGTKYSEEEYNKKILEMNNITKDGNPEIDEYGNKIWKNEKGELHRIDGPAVELVNGDKSWFINGKLHREDGPAVEWANGNKYWYKNDKSHRIDGPAIEYANGDKYWYIEGKQYNEEEYYKLIGKNNSFTKEKIFSTLEKSAYRSAGRQLTKGFVKAFVTIADKKGIDNNTITIISKFFETEIGESIIGMIFGIILPYIPKINNDKRIIKLAEEFQVESISNVSDVIFTEVIQYILPVVGNIITSIPETRIEEEISEEEITSSKNISNV